MNGFVIPRFAAVQVEPSSMVRKIPSPRVAAYISRPLTASASTKVLARPTLISDHEAPPLVERNMPSPVATKRLAPFEAKAFTRTPPVRPAPTGDQLSPLLLETNTSVPVL